MNKSLFFGIILRNSHTYLSQVNPIAIGTFPSGLPILPNPRVLYDQIMETIEPELMTSALQTLTEKYAQETPEERKKRALRYAKAYKQYHEAFASYMSALQRAIKHFTAAATKSFETTYREGEQNDLLELEAAFAAEPSTNPQNSHDA